MRQDVIPNTTDSIIESEFDGLVADVVQEGVVGPWDGLCTRQAANTVRVAAGAGWIDGDGVNVGGVVRNGRFRVTWPQTDINVPNAGTTRLDLIAVQLTGGHGSVGTPVRIAATGDVAAANHKTTAPPALPAGHMRLAQVIAKATGVAALPAEGNDATPGNTCSSVNTDYVRDRRRFARKYVDIDFNATNLQGATGYNSIDIPVDEASGDRSLRVVVEGQLGQETTANAYFYRVIPDGLINPTAGGQRSIRHFSAMDVAQAVSTSADSIRPDEGIFIGQWGGYSAACVFSSHGTLKLRRSTLGMRSYSGQFLLRRASGSYESTNGQFHSWSETDSTDAHFIRLNFYTGKPAVGHVRVEFI